MNGLIEKELSALVSFYRTIEGTYTGAICTKASYTEASYNKRFSELLGEGVMETRATALSAAAEGVVKGLGSKTRSVTVTDCRIAVNPILGKLKVGIDVKIRKGSLITSVSEGTFTGEQEYSVERQAIETTERILDDVDQPMGSNDDQYDAVSNDTRTTESGSDLNSKETNKSFDDDSTSVSAQTIEGRQTMSDVR
jgi:hypothetical protein